MYVFAIRATILIISLAVAYTAHRIRSQKREHYNRPCTSDFGNFNGDNISNCLVCLIEFDRFPREEVLALPCKHKFHKNCIFQVFENEGINGKLCPLCRRAVSKEFCEVFLK